MVIRFDLRYYKISPQGQNKRGIGHDYELENQQCGDIVLLEAEFNDEVMVECKCLQEYTREENGKTGKTIR